MPTHLRDLAGFLVYSHVRFFRSSARLRPDLRLHLRPETPIGPRSSTESPAICRWSASLDVSTDQDQDQVPHALSPPCLLFSFPPRIVSRRRELLVTRPSINGQLTTKQSSYNYTHLCAGHATDTLHTAWKATKQVALQSILHTWWKLECF